MIYQIGFTYLALYVAFVCVICLYIQGGGFIKNETLNIWVGSFTILAFLDMVILIITFIWSL